MRWEDEWVIVGKAAVVYFKVLSRHSPGQSEKTTKNQLGKTITGKRTIKMIMMTMMIVITTLPFPKICYLLHQFLESRKRTVPSYMVFSFSLNRHLGTKVLLQIFLLLME
jgi:hypothetical protein